MRLSSSFVALAIPFLARAAPVHNKRAAADLLVLKFADVLEQLETQFYQQALGKFKGEDFTKAGFSSPELAVQQFENILSDEKAHSVALQDTIRALGDKPITSCKFDFTPALGDVATMAATARVVENVGVGAYLGGATLLTDPVLLDAAGSILTIEARHQTVLNILSAGTSIPSAFDIPLAPSEVLALAGPFVSGCDLGIPANPVLSVTNTGSIGPGTKLSFKSAAINGTVPEDKMFCQMLLGGQPFSIPLPFNECVVPNDINGPVAIFITSDGQPLVNNVRDRATVKTIAGPTMAFIDTKPERLGNLAKTGSAEGGSSSSETKPSESGASESKPSKSNASEGSSASGEGKSSSGSEGGTPTSTSVTTTTISPSEASAVISSAGSEPSAASASEKPASPVNNAASSGPNMFTGPSPDGTVTVMGWKNVPLA
jgi:hypothetical protein